MSLVSSLFLFFVAAALLLYYVVPKSFRFWVILAASLAFSAFLGFYTLLFVLVSAVLCYVGGLLYSGYFRVAVHAVFFGIDRIEHFDFLLVSAWCCASYRRWHGAHIAFRFSGRTSS